jgi:hypothetical protein
LIHHGAMTNPPPPKKQDVLMVRYPDGACHGLQFLRQTELAMAYRARDDGPATSLALDLTTGVITEAATLIADREGKLGCSDAVETLAAATASDLRGIELRALTERVTRRTIGDGVESANTLRAKSQLVRTITRTGKQPWHRLSDDGTSLLYSSGPTLHRVEVASGTRTHSYRCFDRVTHVAERGSLLVAHNKEGVLHFFDARTARPLVYLRVALTGWIAFRDDGAWDASVDNPRGVELSWSDAKSRAFVPSVGFGVLEFNRLPMEQIEPSQAGRTPGLLARSLRAAVSDTREEGA